MRLPVDMGLPVEGSSLVGRSCLRSLPVGSKVQVGMTYLVIVGRPWVVGMQLEVEVLAYLRVGVQVRLGLQVQLAEVVPLCW